MPTVALLALAALFALANAVQLLPWVKEWLDRTRVAKIRPWISPALGAVVALLLVISVPGGLSKALALVVAAVAIITAVNAATRKEEEHSGITTADAMMLPLMVVTVALAGRAAIGKAGAGVNGWEVLGEIAQDTPEGTGAAADPNAREVRLNIYGLRHVSSVPIYHSEVVVGGRDAYSFWGGHEDAGIISRHKPGMVPRLFSDVPTRSFRLGYTTKSDADISDIVDVLRRKGYVASAYDTIRRNCNHFSQAFVSELGIPVTIPTNVNEVARVVSKFAPTASAPVVTERHRLLMRIRDDIRNEVRRRDEVDDPAATSPAYVHEMKIQLLQDLYDRIKQGMPIRNAWKAYQRMSSEEPPSP